MPAEYPLNGEQSLPAEPTQASPVATPDALPPANVLVTSDAAVFGASEPEVPAEAPRLAEVDATAPLEAEAPGEAVTPPGAGPFPWSSASAQDASVTEEAFATEAAPEETPAAGPQPVPEPVVAAPAVRAETLPPALRLLAAFERNTSVVTEEETSSLQEPQPSVREEPGVDAAAELGVRRRAQVAPALIALERIDDDATFQVRPAGDVSLLATDIARVGQLFPVDVRLAGPDRFQVVCGFRRVAALRFLHREFVLARVHTDLGDEDALLMALAAAIHATPVGPDELEAVRSRLALEGRLFAAARDMLDKALNPEDDLAPEGVEEEVDADELAADVAQRLGAINQDLSLLADVFQSLDESRRAELLMQLRYSAELVAYLEGLS